MPELTTPRDLFLHELGDILYVERALAKETLPKLIGEVSDEEFKSGSRATSSRPGTRHQRREGLRAARRGARGREVVGFEGLKKEHDQLIEESSSTLVDIIDVGAAARTENYESPPTKAAQDGQGHGREQGRRPPRYEPQAGEDALREVEKIATRLSNESAKRPRPSKDATHEAPAPQAWGGRPN